jgi:hypothetical protein
MTGRMSYWALPFRSKPLEEIRGRWSRAAKEWAGHINYPFSGYIDKPRESLSKHDRDPKRSHNHWHCDDVVFLCSAHKDIEVLLQISGKSFPLVKEMFDTISNLDASTLPPALVERFSVWDKEVKEIMKLVELKNDCLDTKEQI